MLMRFWVTMWPVGGLILVTRLECIMRLGWSQNEAVVSLVVTWPVEFKFWWENRPVCWFRQQCVLCRNIGFRTHVCLGQFGGPVLQLIDLLNLKIMSADVKFLDYIPGVLCLYLEGLYLWNPVILWRTCTMGLFCEYLVYRSSGR